MRLRIRSQLLLPLLALMLGVVGASTWSAWSSAQRARRQIEEQMEHIAQTVNAVTIPRNTQTLRLMKGLSGADLLIGDETGQPLMDDFGRPVMTLPVAPAALPPVDTRADFGHPVNVAGTSYVALATPLTHGSP